MTVLVKAQAAELQQQVRMFNFGLVIFMTSPNMRSTATTFSTVGERGGNREAEGCFMQQPPVS